MEQTIIKLLDPQLECDDYRINTHHLQIQTWLFHICNFTYRFIVP